MKERLSSIGGIATSILAAGCCIGPALFLAFGITGLGFLSRLEWLRPYFLLATFIFLVIAYHYAYGNGSQCGADGKCDPKIRKINRILFWILVGFAIFGISFPYAAGSILA